MPSLATHHPEGEFLLDYATGAAPEGVAVLVATHLALCPECRRVVRAFEGVSAESLNWVPAGIEVGASEPDVALLPQSGDGQTREAVLPDAVFPEPLRSYAGGQPGDLPWRRTLFGPHEVVLKKRGRVSEVKLLRLSDGSGMFMPRHTHAGSELTLVLQGAFRDVTGVYSRGDVAIADPSLVHRPLAEPGEDCICLAVLDAPLRFAGTLGALLAPFLPRY